LPSANQAAKALIQKGMDQLAGRDVTDDVDEPCDYLQEDGCVFPGDLRPFECSRWICPYLKKSLTSGEMREIRDLMHRFAAIHRELLDAAMR
jgi:hypothetical protein